MDSATINPEIPESLMADEKTHNVAGTDLTISALYYSGTNGEGVTELKLGSPKSNSVKNEDKMGDDFIDPSSEMISGLVVIAPQEDNYHKYDVSINGRPNSPDHEEIISTVKQALKQEIMEEVIKKKETYDVSMEEIYNNQITKEEIHDCKESIKLEDDMNCPCVDNINKFIKTEGHSVVMKNELSDEQLYDDFAESERFDGDSGESDDQVSRTTGKPRNHPRTAMAASYDGGSDYANVSSKNDSLIDIKQEVHSGQNHHNDAPIESSSDNRSHRCEICGKYYENVSSLKIHLRQIHRMYCCDYCDRKFIQLIQYEAHLLDPNNSKNNKCTNCDKTLMCISEVLQHSWEHTGKRPYPCTTCQKMYMDQNILEIHQRTHTGQKPYRCTTCDKYFRNPGDLKSHQRMHTGEKPFGCTMCDKSFTRQNDLTVHQKIHTGENPYVCTMCDKGFTRQSNLTIHLRTHTRVKLHQCTICDKCFSDRSNLKVHQRTHAGEKP